MKKVLMMLVAAACTLAVSATQFGGRLKVSVNDESMSQATTITINETEGKYSLELKNFILGNGEDALGVGNIVVGGLDATEEVGYKTIKFSGNITIAEGDDPSISMWMGPFLGEVPIAMTADFNENGACQVSIDIDMMATLEQIIKVQFIGNAGSGIKGDVNGDGNVDVVDVNNVINIILGN